MLLPKNIEAGEILTTGYCPLDCKYCYIPKSDEMKEVHKEIVEDLVSDKTINKLSELYGDNLKSLGLWGTEPILTMDIIKEKIPLIFDLFPKLNHITYSTAGVYDPEIVIGFIDKINEQVKGKHFKIDHQISIDGPEWITDENRMVGATKLIEENTIKMIKGINNINLDKEIEINISWKPTIDISNMEKFILDRIKIPDFLDFFVDLCNTLNKMNIHSNVNIVRSFLPTLMVPGKFTSRDGRIFTQFLKAWHCFGLTSYTGRLERLFAFDNHSFKRRQYTCSGGDSNLGLGEQIHMCHRTFYMNRDKYVETILSKDMDNWDVSLYNGGMIDYVKKNYIIDPDDEFEMNRFLYVMRGHHDFWKFQLSYIKSMMTSLALAGQVSPKYLDNDDLVELFGRFMLTAMSCPMENLLNTANINLIPVSLLRLWGNGAFEEILKTCLKK